MEGDTMNEHNWVAGDIELLDENFKSVSYTCSKCKLVFKTYYQHTKDRYENTKICPIPKTCKG